MAFSKAPSQSTYQTRDVKTIWALRNRDASGTKDTIALNGFYDIVADRSADDKDVHFVKRDGTVKYPYSIPSGTVRGMYYWEDEDKLYIAYSDKVAICTGSTGALVTTVTPFTSTTGDVGFTEFYYDTGETKIVVADGVKLATIDASNVLVVGADADQPSPFNPHVVFLDGYLFLHKTDTSDIYNSDLNDPLAFTAGDFITAEMVADTLKRIFRLNNYIVALGTASIEYFYDAANASGSPLGRQDTPVKNIGYVGGLVQYGNKAYIIGQTQETSPEVYALEDWKISPMDNPPLRRYLRAGVTPKTAIASIGGRDFYILTAGTITYMADLETKLWTRLAHKNGTTFPAIRAVNVPISGNCSLVAMDTGTDLFYFNPAVYQDDGVNFTATVQTYKQTFDTFHEKYMSRLLVIADRASASTLEVSWTDDDYQTFSAVRQINLAIERPVVHRLGRFLERAFKLNYTQNAPLRVDHLEVDFNIGNR